MRPKKHLLIPPARHRQLVMTVMVIGVAHVLTGESGNMEHGVYRHYKGGLYTTLMAARCSDNGPNEGENVVVYVSHTTGAVCTRLAKDFFGKVVGVNRFEFVASRLGVPG